MVRQIRAVNVAVPVLVALFTAVAGSAASSSGSVLANPATNPASPEPVPCLEGCGAGAATRPTTPAVLEFDGVDDVALSAGGFDWDVGGDHTELAVSFWIYRGTFDDFGYLTAYGSYRNGAPMLTYRMYYSGGKCRVETAAAAGFKFWRMTTADTIDVGRWVHVAWSCEPDGDDEPVWRGWFDGVEDESIVLALFGANVADQQDSLYLAPADSASLSANGTPSIAPLPRARGQCSVVHRRDGRVRREPVNPGEYYCPDQDRRVQDHERGADNRAGRVIDGLDSPRWLGDSSPLAHGPWYGADGP